MAQVLRYLPPVTDPNVIVGTNTADDAAVYRISPELALIQTVDFFTPVVDDPYTFGQIAAANSLSDIYAMGAQPSIALNIAGFPAALPLEVLGDILRGGADKAAEAGVSVVGGHTIQDDEPKYGMAVTGWLHPDKVVTNHGARSGDQLIITKPLGLGVITTAIKGEMIEGLALDRAVGVMTALNKAASEVMTRVGVHACTDVTGFGLLGHLYEMLCASGVSARLNPSAVPVLEEAWELLAMGILPAGTRRNLSSLEGHLLVKSGVTEDQMLAMADPQTSGGLLIAVAQDKAAYLLAELHKAGVADAVVIGEAVSSPPKQDSPVISLE